METETGQEKLQRGMLEVNKVLRFSESFKLIKKAVESDGMGFVREQCIIDLYNLGDKRVPGALFHLLDLEGNLGFWVGLAIARLGDKEEVLPRLIERLQDPSIEVKEHVISALGNLGERQLDPEMNQAYRLNASVSDFSQKDDRIIEALLPMLDDPEPRVRSRAVSTLCHLADPRTTERVVKALEDPDRSVRICAANALGSTGDKRAIPALLKALEAGDKEIDSRARQSLDFLGYEGKELKPLASGLFQALAGLNASQAEKFTDEYFELGKDERQDAFSALLRQRFKKKMPGKDKNPG
ncbi:MAG: HEAT repeat domain-containing protein [Chloroflexi bacterium]|nr:HEAT repeat domain-containing protein [Chloroflexota bacterium]